MRAGVLPLPITLSPLIQDYPPLDLHLLPPPPKSFDITIILFISPFRSKLRYISTVFFFIHGAVCTYMQKNVHRFKIAININLRYSCIYTVLLILMYTYSKIYKLKVIRRCDCVFKSGAVVLVKCGLIAGILHRVPVMKMFSL